MRHLRKSIIDPGKAASGVTSDANIAKIQDLLNNEKYAKGDSNLFGGNSDIFDVAQMVLQDSCHRDRVVFSIHTLAYIVESARNMLLPAPRMPAVGPKLTDTVIRTVAQINVAALRAAGVSYYSDDQVMFAACSVLHALITRC